MVKGRQMGTELMGSACPRAEPETRSGFHPLQTTPEREARLAVGMHAIGGRLTIQTRQGEIDPSADRSHRSLNISEIQLPDPSRCKQSAQHPLRVGILRQKHES